MFILFGAFTVFPKDISDAVRLGVRSCLDVIIPSLYVMMVLSDIFIKSGLYKKNGFVSEFAARYIFRVPPSAMSAFTVSIAAGYPVGASVILGAYENGSVNKTDAERLLCYSFGSGPAFVFAAVGAGVFGNVRAGVIIFISGIIANVITGFILSVGRKIPEKETRDVQVSFSSSLFCESAADAGKNILKMCGVILVTSALLCIPESLGITPALSARIGKILECDPQYVHGFIRSLFDVTNLSRMNSEDISFLPFAAFLVSFGGVSVFMQIAAVLNGKLSIAPMIISRGFAAALSFFISDFFTRILIQEEAVSVMAHIGEVRHNSLLSSAFLLIMVILLLSEKKEVNK